MQKGTKQNNIMQKKNLTEYWLRESEIYEKNA